MTKLAFGLILLLAGCAKPQLVLYDPADPALIRKLGISSHEWREMQAQVDSLLARSDLSDLRLSRWGRSNLTGDIEVWFAHAVPKLPKNSGPVFFFRHFDGQWHLVTEEMSEWKDP
jgi:hypothetical protein